MRIDEKQVIANTGIFYQLINRLFFSIRLDLGLFGVRGSLVFFYSFFQCRSVISNKIECTIYYKTTWNLSLK